MPVEGPFRLKPCIEVTVGTIHLCIVIRAHARTDSGSSKAKNLGVTVLGMDVNTSLLNTLYYIVSR